MYAGRSLSEWYWQWSDYVDFRSDEKDPKAIEAKVAIQGIGTNALPLLIERISYPPEYPSSGMLLVYKIPLIGEKMEMKAAEPHKRANDATGIFHVLGPLAAPAIPELTDILMTTRSEDVRHRAVFSLGKIGDESLPVFIDVLQRTNDPARKAVAQWLGMDANFPFSTNLVRVVPTLVAACGDNDTGVVIYSIRALGKIRLDPDLAVPALTNAIHSPIRENRIAAVRALWAYGEEFNGDAITALNRALDDSDWTVRNVATNVLQNINDNSFPAMPD